MEDVKASNEHDNAEPQREQRPVVISGDDPFAHYSIGEYLTRRVTTLIPPLNPVPNPITALSRLNAEQWRFFLIGFAGWTWDALDFFTVSLTVPDLAKTFGKKPSDITWGITLVLMLRSVGAIIFGMASDRYGRKWPFIINNLLFIALELGTGFVRTFREFLAVRALFGIAMGGLYGNAAATALEDCPVESRGIISGIFQQGYAFGYLLATVFARALVNTTPHEWRPLFWFAACPPAILIILRYFMPETQAFRERQLVRSANSGVANRFLAEGRIALRRHWLLLTYMVLLMAGMNFISHSTQDLYPTMLQNQFEFSANAVTVTQVVANLGAMLGGTVVGWLSQSLGRRFTIIIMCVMGGALIYPYTYVTSEKVMAVAFFEQFAVQGAWGVIPIHLSELSPGSFRTFVVGTSYQLGNLASSASATIEAKLGEQFPLPPANGVARYQYGRAMCIFCGAVFAYIILITFIGPEYLGRSFAAEADNDFETAVGGHEEVSRALHPHAPAAGDELEPTNGEKKTETVV